jgi:hypothetical protein
VLYYYLPYKGIKNPIKKEGIKDAQSGGKKQ